MNVLRRFFIALLDGVLVPRVCVLCGNPLAAGSPYVCTACMASVPVCHADGVEMLDLRARIVNAVAPAGLVSAWTLYDPSHLTAGLVRMSKYGDAPGLARWLGQQYGRDLMLGYERMAKISDSEVHPSDIDVLLPMPMHRSKLLSRGYNQAEMIALGISDVTGIPVGDNLVAVRPHRTQTRLDNKARMLNVEGCFSVECGDELSGLNVAVVDDVITTGASMCEAAGAISRGAPEVASVSFLALAHTIRGI
ncbi:MAG: hypothetical protein K2J38_04770 [Muribaculaceae bacterium]|nr:hypothetical protein [Muribaculaceae bacterium]